MIFFFFFEKNFPSSLCLFHLLSAFSSSLLSLLFHLVSHFLNHLFPSLVFHLLSSLRILVLSRLILSCLEVTTLKLRLFFFEKNCGTR